MRVVAFLVVACGCRVAASSAVDAAAVQGDGLSERVIADAELWNDRRSPISTADRAAGPDRRVGDGAVDTGDTGAAGADGGAGGAFGQGCALLGAEACVGDEGCYPFPFEARMPDQTRCAFQGVGGPSIPCQSQLECDELTLCSAPGEPDSICLQRCNLANPRCPTGQDCGPYFSYSGVGTCR